MRRRIAAVLAALLLLSLGSAASGATAGDREDPLLSQGYVDGTFSQSVLDDAKKAFEFTLGRLRDEMTADSGERKSTGSYSVLSVLAGSTATLDLGDSIILLSGEANVTLNSGALVNVTVGAEAVSGRLLPNHRYLACEDCAATVAFTADSVFAADGSVSVTGNVSPFTDVTPKNWFYDDVVAAVQRGLVDGVTPTTYNPQGNLRVSQCVKLAACMHQLYHTGSVTLENSESGKWYRSYVDYALQNGILDAEFEDYEVYIGRLDFVRVFFRAMPESAYATINTVADDSIPDVKLGDPGAREIYAFYRSGVLSGYSDYSNDNTLGSAPLRELSPLVAVGDICIYRHKGNRQWYVNKHISGAPKTFDNGEVELQRFRSSHIWLWRAYLNRKVLFDSYSTELLFRQYFGA